MNLKKIFNSVIVALVTITMSSNSILLAKANSAKVVSDWRFDSNYVQEGTSFEQNNLILKDASGNGNDLIVNTERVESGKLASDYMEFVDDSINGKSESLLMCPKGTSGNDKKIGAFFQTVENAPITHETFDEGYTFEFIIKLSDDISGWSSIFGKRGIAKQNGLTGGEPEVNGGLNVSSSGELQWNFYTNNPEVKNNPTTWSDAGGIQRNKFHHIVVKNDSNVTTMIVDGIVVLRCNTTQYQRGLADLGLGWVVGTAYWSDGETFDEKTCGDSIFKGQIQEIRLSSGLVTSDDYLVTEYIVDDAYNIAGNNDETNFLETRKNYNFAIIPDPQYTTQYKPAILDAQNEWIAENANDYNIAMTLGVGDITQDGTEAEFKRASESYSIFDEKNIPYLLTDGNHDSSIYLKYFGAQRYENNPAYQGAGPSGYSKYAITKGGSYNYLFLTIPYNSEQIEQDREWINNILTTYDNLPTVIITHFDDNNKNITNDFVKKYNQVFMFIEGHVTYRDAKIITNDYGHPVLNAIVNYQFEPYGGNGIIRLMQFDELNKEISFQSYSPWVQKKMDILDNKIENKGILNDDEKKLFPFDKLNITQDPSDNITFKFDFTERFKNLDKIESINRENLDEEISLSNSYNLSQYQDGNEKDNFINALSNAKNIQKDLDEQDSLLTQEIVESACKKLKEARLSLISITNKIALKIAVDLANAITDKDLEKVIPAVVEEFKAARDEANVVYNNASALQVEVNKAFDRLVSIMQKLEFFKGDKTALKTFIDKVNDLDSNKYTQVTWIPLNEALTAATVVYNDENAMQEEVNNAYKGLVTAFLDLRLKPNKDLLEDLINKAENINPASYTAETVRILNSALEDATVVLNNENVDQKVVNEAYVMLNNAFEGLVAVNSGNPTTPNLPINSAAPNDSQVNIKLGDTTVSVKIGDAADFTCVTTLCASIAALAYLAVSKKRKED